MGVSLPIILWAGLLGLRSSFSEATSLEIFLPSSKTFHWSSRQLFFFQFYLESSNFFVIEKVNGEIEGDGLQGCENYLLRIVL